MISNINRRSSNREKEIKEEMDMSSRNIVKIANSREINTKAKRNSHRGNILKSHDCDEAHNRKCFQRKSIGWRLNKNRCSIVKADAKKKWNESSAQQKICTIIKNISQEQKRKKIAIPQKIWLQWIAWFEVRYRKYFENKMIKRLSAIRRYPNRGE